MKIRSLLFEVNFKYPPVTCVCETNMKIFFCVKNTFFLLSKTKKQLYFLEINFYFYRKTKNKLHKHKKLLMIKKISKESIYYFNQKSL